MNRDKIGRYTHSFIRKFIEYTKRTVALVFAVGLFGAFTTSFIGADTINYNAPIIHFNEVEAQEIETILPPVMDRIAKCESDDKQFGKSGQVLMNANTNDTVDIGYMQINTVWFAKATELDLDLTKKEDNIKMGLWIYENVGTSPWSSSAKCWNK